MSVDGRSRFVLVALTALTLPPVALATGDGEPPVAIVLPAVDLGGAAYPQTGRVVRASRGVWSGEGLTYRMQWERCVPGESLCAPIDGAAAATYAPGEADVGRALRVRVSVTATGGAGEAVSAATAPVDAGRTGGAAPAPASRGPEDARAAALGGGGESLSGLPRRLVVTYGRRLTLHGRLDGGGALARVTLAGPDGAAVAWSEPGASGAFGLRAEVHRGGSWRVSGPRSTATISVALRPIVRLTAVPRALRTPAVVEVRGRLLPAVYRKSVELHYLDPGRGWRLWKQARTDGHGRFRLARLLARNPGVGRFPLRIRVAVPADRGSPFAPAVSPEATVLVR